MKTKICFFILLINIAFINKNIFSQSKLLADFKNNFNLYWNIAEIGLQKTTIDPVIGKSIKAALPELINNNIDSAVNSLCKVIYKEKGINIFHKTYVDYTKNNLIQLEKAVNNKSYGKIIYTLSDIAYTTTNLIEKNILPDGKKALPIPDFEGKIYVNYFNDYSIYYPCSAIFYPLSENIYNEVKNKNSNNSNNNDEEGHFVDDDEYNTLTWHAFVYAIGGMGKIERKPNELPNFNKNNYSDVFYITNKDTNHILFVYSISKSKQIELQIPDDYFLVKTMQPKKIGAFSYSIKHYSQKETKNGESIDWYFYNMQSKAYFYEIKLYILNKYYNARISDFEKMLATLTFNEN